MKTYFTVLFLGIGLLLNAQSIDYNTKKGFAVHGYDVVAYFDGSAEKGSKDFVVTHDGVKYKFSSQENLDKFKENPVQYLPQYGGYCAYAVALKSKKVNVDPNTFEIRDDKLYLFYNSWGTNTLESWLAKTPDILVEKADANWEQIKY
ncbi:YHS domain-containing (seleno)protein [Winogradskyella sp. 3972H.M.0a.05]|uniref:YHS domain-containing (seleno)protein n=1 Tax=Winogradskyella sp. 3972H.M.0a.05 TaxID=2950277 RepID=UPI0033927BD7